MELLGEVKVIINDDLILISSDKTLKNNDVVTIFSSIPDNNIEETTGIKYLMFPKGKVAIICNQTEQIYLAKRFRELKEKKKVITEPSPWAKTVAGYLGQLVAEKYEIVEVYGPWSAEFDKEKNLNIEIETSIKIGDLVGRI